MRREGGNPTLGFEAGGGMSPHRAGAPKPPVPPGAGVSPPHTFNEKEMHFLHKPEGKYATAKRKTDGEVPFPELL